MTVLTHLQTPCLLLEQSRFERNVERMQAHLAALGVQFRPHLKTAKSIEVARRVMVAPGGPGMVSTLREAEYFAGQGVRDLIYGVGIAPAKLDQLGAIRARHGADLALILDSVEQADAVAAWSRAHAQRLPALIEIDADGHRSGVLPSDRQRLVAIGQALHRGGAELRGVLTHAGGSYALHRPEDIAAAAAAGSGLDQVLKVTAYIAGVEHWPAFNRIYAEVFAEARPARSVVPVPALHHGYLVEIEAIAVRPAER